MVAASGFQPPVWKQSDGKAVSCLEKIKVLNQNFAELRQLAADAVEDGVLMGCDPRQLKAALHELVETLPEPPGGPAKD